MHWKREGENCGKPPKTEFLNLLKERKGTDEREDKNAQDERQKWRGEKESDRERETNTERYVIVPTARPCAYIFCGLEAKTYLS